MGVDYTAKVVVGVLLTDEQARSYGEWTDERSWREYGDIDNYVHLVGSCYERGGTQTIVGCLVKSVDDCGAIVMPSTDGAGYWVEANERVQKFSERTGLVLNPDDVHIYLGLLVH